MKNSVFLLLVVSLFFSCQPELPLVLGEVQGIIINELSKQPQPDIMVYLLDQTYRADSANSESQETILDSTITNQNGFYLFDSLSPGKYSVVPFDLSMNFIHVDTTDPYNFEISSSEKYQVDYMANPNAMSVPFTFDVHFINVPNHNDLQHIGVLINRRYWVLWAPMETQVSYEFVSRDVNNEYHLTKQVGGGYFLLFYTLDNYFEILSETIDSGGNYISLAKFYLETSIFDTPSLVKWEFDCESKTLTRIQ